MTALGAESLPGVANPTAADGTPTGLSSVKDRATRWSSFFRSPPIARDAFRHPSADRWFDNAESFCRIGLATGAAMLELLR